MAETTFNDRRLDIHPALDVLKFSTQVDDHLDRKIRDLLERMDRNTKLYNDITSLLQEFGIGTNELHDILDFESSAEFKEIMDELYDLGFLKEDSHGQRQYKFDGDNQINGFKAKLEGISQRVKNDNQKPFLLIQPLLTLLEHMSKIAKACTEQDERFKSATSRNKVN